MKALKKQRGQGLVEYELIAAVIVVVTAIIAANPWLAAWGEAIIAYLTQFLP